MPLTPIPNRTPQHMRDVRYRSYAREDGLWDIEGELVDQKTHDIELHGGRKVPAHTPIHHMWIRATVDAKLVVHAIEAVMDSHPLEHCPQATLSMQKMVGCCMARGWRKAINENLGSVAGCTHMRELLFNMATAAFQSVHGAFQSSDRSEPPRHLGQCLGWDFNGPGVARYYPQFAGWQPLQRQPLPAEARSAQPAGTE
ncbi:DUF2889 domain-containing protein [Comamonas sp. w2-DMI]|uniref:DUF2889 domain-containing protein n=1 Tax=Comamonas sp. w2-DMI TaxID=3126391 RepID=UPI0032E439DA